MSDDFWKTTATPTSGILTEESLRRAYELMRESGGGPDVEYHHPLCPKITSLGKLACRCGAAPLEAIFEDELRDPTLPKSARRT